MARTRKQKQPIPPEQKYSRAQFNAAFPDDEACFRHLAESRFPGGMAMGAKCGRERKQHRVTGRKAPACDTCRRQLPDGRHDLREEHHGATAVA